MAVPPTERQTELASRGAPVEPTEARPEPLVHVRRAGRVESTHRGHVAVVDAAGRLVAHAGEPRTLIYPRSAFKPFQALPVVESGAWSRSGLGPDALALVAGSHGGTDAHAALAAAILRAADAAEADLACGTHVPFDKATAAALRARDEAPGPLRHNCSGKHAGMLLLARALGAPLSGYTDPRHPVQRRIVERFEALMGEPLPDAEPGTDGCSAPNPRLPLSTLAHAFALLGRGVDASEARAPALAAIRDAMREHPEQVAGEGLLDTALMRALPGVVAKIGAEAVHAVALPDRGWGVALKIEDGADRAVGPAAIAVLQALDALDPAGTDAGLEPFASRPLRNHAGVVVGDIRAVARLVRDRA